MRAAFKEITTKENKEEERAYGQILKKYLDSYLKKATFLLQAEKLSYRRRFSVKELKFEFLATKRLRTNKLKSGSEIGLL